MHYYNFYLEITQTNGIKYCRKMSYCWDLDSAIALLDPYDEYDDNIARITVIKQEYV